MNFFTYLTRAQRIKPITEVNREFKLKSFSKETNGQRGFVPDEIAKRNKAKDFKEFYHIGRELPVEEIGRLKLYQNI